MNTTQAAQPAAPIIILLAEDNPADVELARTALEETGLSYVLEVVEDGEEALLYLTRQDKFQAAKTPTLIILDLNLPKLSGKEVLKAIRQNEVLRTLPVIISTSSHAKSDITDSYRLEADYYITKPVDADKFRAALGADDGSGWISSN